MTWKLEARRMVRDKRDVFFHCRIFSIISCTVPSTKVHICVRSRITYTRRKQKKKIQLANISHFYCHLRNDTKFCYVYNNQCKSHPARAISTLNKIALYAFSFFGEGGRISKLFGQDATKRHITIASYTFQLYAQLYENH